MNKVISFLRISDETYEFISSWLLPLIGNLRQISAVLNFGLPSKESLNYVCIFVDSNIFQPQIIDPKSPPIISPAIVDKTLIFHLYTVWMGYMYLVNQSINGSINQSYHSHSNQS